jgi:predicted AlkP superfamily pyrophosphatase or phosphodiesterase
MRRTLVLDVVGLSPRHVGDDTPHLAALARAGAMRPLRTITPAVTCSVQSTFTTGLLPRDHGSVGNGWYFRDLSEVSFWRQSNPLVAGEKIWEAARRRDASFTCAKLFWWYNMYASVDWAITPRPQYPADGRKIPDVYTQPADLHDELVAELGPFPLFRFWGPAADITCTQWIGASAAHVMRTRQPTLTLVYLPHLDYDLQRFGPDHPAIADQLRAVDTVCGELIELAARTDTAVIVLSEYGITEVIGAVPINKVLREAGLLHVRQEDAGEMLDAGASEAFAVVDHQVAHVYVRRAERIGEVAALVRAQDGVEAVWDASAKRAAGLDHPRSGELVAISAPDRWFCYPYWLDDARAPDFARTVDIHRKPGYDPVELFLDPTIRFPKLTIASKLLLRRLGFRTLMNVISLDPSLVRGSHGRLTDSAADGPVLITNQPSLLPETAEIPAQSVKELILRHLFAA